MLRHSRMLGAGIRASFYNARALRVAAVRALTSFEMTDLLSYCHFEQSEKSFCV